MMQSVSLAAGTLAFALLCSVGASAAEQSTNRAGAAAVSEPTLSYDSEAGFCGQLVERQAPEIINARIAHNGAGMWPDQSAAALSGVVRCLTRLYLARGGAESMNASLSGLQNIINTHEAAIRARQAAEASAKEWLGAWFAPETAERILVEARRRDTTSYTDVGVGYRGRFIERESEAIQKLYRDGYAHYSRNGVRDRHVAANQTARQMLADIRRNPEVFGPTLFPKCTRDSSGNSHWETFPHCQACEYWRWAGYMSGERYGDANYYYRWNEARQWANGWFGREGLHPSPGIAWHCENRFGKREDDLRQWDREFIGHLTTVLDRVKVEEHWRTIRAPRPLEAGPMATLVDALGQPMPPTEQQANAQPILRFVPEEYRRSLVTRDSLTLVRAFPVTGGTDPAVLDPRVEALDAEIIADRKRCGVADATPDQRGNCVRATDAKREQYRTLNASARDVWDDQTPGADRLLTETRAFMDSTNGYYATIYGTPGQQRSLDLKGPEAKRLQDQMVALLNRYVGPNGALARAGNVTPHERQVIAQAQAWIDYVQRYPQPSLANTGPSLQQIQAAATEANRTLTDATGGSNQVPNAGQALEWAAEQNTAAR